MANTTKLKPRRVNSFNEPSDGKNLGYKNTDEFKWQESGPSEGYIKYEDYEWNALIGSSITIEDISNNITPSSDFTVSSGTVKPGMEYVLRVSSGSNPYEMTLGTGVTNPNGYKTELKPNTVSQFKFIATSENQLELEGVDSAVISEINWGEIEGILSDQTDLQNALNLKADDNKIVHLAGSETITGTKTFQAEPILPSKSSPAGDYPTKPATEAQVAQKLSELTILSYGNSTWNDFITAYQKNAVIYCRASSNSDPATGSQTRMAFMAYVNNASSPTEVEFQYYRSRSSHGSDANQQDEVYVYKLTSAGAWTVAVRDTAAKIATGTGLTKAYTTSGNTSTLTITNDGVTTVNGTKGAVQLDGTYLNKANTDSYTPSGDYNPATKKYVDDQVTAATQGAVSNEAYDASTWDGVNGIAPSKNAVRDKIVTMDSNISGNATDISTINGKIPSAASTTNQLADKDFVNSSINSIAAYYITKNAAGDQWSNRAELFAATTFYSGGEVRVPTKNDYTIVLSDEQHDNATTRYIYNNGWEYQYTVNETPLTQAQLNALNSGITVGKVSTYDGYATGKQDTLVSGTNIKTINNESLLGSGNISINGILSGPLTPAASATYAGRIWFNTMNNKFWKCDGTTWTEVTPVLSVNGLTGAITVNDVKVSSTAPANPSAGTVWYDTANNLLKSYNGSIWTSVGAVLSVNGQTGAVLVNDVKVDSTAPANPSAGTIWYDTTNNLLKSYDGSNWNNVGEGDMAYDDFSWKAKSGTTITLDLACTITPTANFTVNAPTTIKDGQSYILRVNNQSTAYTMTLGTGITNPFGTDLTLTAGGVDQFLFLAIGGNLELQPEANGGVTSVNGQTGDVTINEGEASSIATTQPPNPVEGDVYYDTTNDVIKVYDGTNWTSTVKDMYIKLFEMTETAGATQTQQAQDIIDRINGGNNIRTAVISSDVNNAKYYGDNITGPSNSKNYLFRHCPLGYNNNGYILQEKFIRINVQNGTVNAVYVTTNDTNLVTAETVLSGDSGTTYTIKVSDTAPASGTASNVITFVTE